MNVQAVHAHLEKHFDEDLERVREFLRMSSVSYTGEGIQETASTIKDIIEKLGGEAEVVQTKGHPVVYGEFNEGQQHTLLIYGMYDVMPTDEEDWTVDPWGAQIRDLPQFGPCIISRGAVNTKGPLAALFNVLGAIKEVEGKLPVNLVFAIEGEEEMGSRHFPAFLEEYREKFAKAEAVLFPFFEQDETGVPNITLGTKGMLYFELSCQGGDWGGPRSRGIHGSFNAWVKNPAWRLVQALSKLVDVNENFLIENFEKDVSPLDQKEMNLLQSQIEAGSFDENVFLENYDVKRLKYDGEGMAVWEKLFSRPQLNINGIYSGYCGPETKTVLPHVATAKIDVRMVPHMVPDQVIQAIRDHLDKNGFPDIEMKIYNNYYWSKVSIDECVVQAMIDTYRVMGKEPQIWPIEPGSAPYYVFERYLKIPYVAGGMGHGARQHSSNEYCTVQGVLDFEKSMVIFFDQYVKKVAAMNQPDQQCSLSTE
ncbi:M20/M25/M40 family metallo-hydrolase [Brevibacillus fluminis]|uniref:M20/M25/M40 family metallo-hydrolase n=2 Tax=Brevibacillus fluminis TaxID=511487 RepID=A0A3M8DHW5_9BACL|nr:M20/M25/M40 family metallo-hydrolase [Brevibacillus fluminis]